ncbi:MAG: phosphomannomutase/phosphoglucomutase [Anaerolineae bacterium]|nr:phosphomannomutase/phosphoglucomutase [Anaerolineae bacterium]
MDPNIFRAYSIRGVAGESLTVNDMNTIGKAAGTLFAELGITNVVVGRDYRTSSAALGSALIDGLLFAGMDVVDIGACHTPLLNFATDHYRVGAGLMVTASHNPASYNGLKIRTDHSLRGDELEHIYRVAVSGAFRQGEVGTLTHADPVDDYLEAIRASVEMGRTLRVVVDAGNGAAGPFAPRLVEALGCQPIPLYCEPDGRFPNRVPDPKASGALDALASRVVAENADAGLAYDGDGDRLVMVDNAGQAVYGDQLLALLAQEMLSQRGRDVGAPSPLQWSSLPGEGRGEGNNILKVVYELSCTQAVPEIVEALGGKAIPCPVGYVFVHEAMQSTGAVMGGESAGHLFFAEPGFQFDDAMLATAKMLSLLSRVDRALSQLVGQLPQYHLSPAYRFHCPDDKKAHIVGDVKTQFCAQGYQTEDMDGVKVYFDDGWGLFRSSNTQPAVTLCCEARTPLRLAEIEQEMLGVVRQAMCDVGIQVSDAH